MIFCLFQKQWRFQARSAGIFVARGVNPWSMNDPHQTEPRSGGTLTGWLRHYVAPVVGRWISYQGFTPLATKIYVLRTNIQRKTYTPLYLMFIFQATDDKYISCFFHRV
jgi:hypothetical protein